MGKMSTGGSVLATLGCLESNYDTTITCTWDPFAKRYCTDHSYEKFWNYFHKIGDTPIAPGYYFT